MVAPVDICNAAIIRLGGAQITSMGENNVEAVSLNSQYDIVRRALLRSLPWNFATRRAVLARDLVPPAWGYANSFTLPFDCLRVIATNDQDDNYAYGLGSDFNGYLTISSRTDYSSFGNYKIEGRKILSHDSELKIKYIKDETDSTMFDSSFIRLFAVMLAYECCLKITGSIQARDDLKEEINVLTLDAQSNNGQEGVRSSIQTSQWIASRL